MKIKILLLSLLIVLGFNTKAQYITIPDTNFTAWLNLNIPSAMIGNQMDTTHIAITTLTSVDVSGDTILDLFGIQYFTSLEILDCSYNKLTGLPALPLTLQTLKCGGNLITTLPALPSSITYFVCAQNQLISLPALPSSLIEFNCQNNLLTSLPALPTGITTMECSGNQLDSLPSLPGGLITLNCGENQLTLLPTLPATLESLNCDHNPISNLPVLPITLTYLNCGADSLTALPSLPSSLITLECWMNYLTSLPSLPSSLTTLVCGWNQLTNLPTLPASLITLKCYANQLPALPVLPPSLVYLDCNTNFLTGLPTLSISLTYLDCSYNQLSALPTLPGTLLTLNCNSNLMPVLTVLPPSLNTLTCSNNPLTELPALSSLYHLTCDNATLDSLPTLPSTLNYLSCTGNYLIALPSLPSALSALMCYSNQLTALPLLPTSLTALHCFDNQLTSLPALPSNLTQLGCTNNYINCFPEFPFSLLSMNISPNPFTCLPNYIPAMDSITLLYPLCVDGDFVNNPYGCDGAEGVLGFTYTDVNTNCLKDSLDNNLKNIPVRLFNSAGGFVSQTYTAMNGVYHFPEPTGTYDVIIDTVGIPISPVCATPGIDTTVSVTLTDPLIMDVNFDFGCKPGYDVGVRSVLHCGLVFPGQPHQLKADAGDMTQWFNLACASGISGQVEITVTGPVTFTGITLGALMPSIAGNVYTYSIADFGTIINTQAFGLILTVDSTAGSGNQICVSIDVTPAGGDNDPGNNSYDFCYLVVNSHDPNMKETYPEVVLPLYQDWFTYTIHFQNTGSAPAINIHLRDTLDSHLDLTTFEVIGSSHDNYVILNGNALMVQFPNIYLADSTTSVDSSKGFIQYRLKPFAGLPGGTQIFNRASIYFDFNEAIVTNTTVNSFRQTVASIEEVKTEVALNIYPNPAKDDLTINYQSSSKSYEATIYDLTGRNLSTIEMNGDQNNISISELEPGIYFISILDGKNVSTKRFVKQ